VEKSDTELSFSSRSGQTKIVASWENTASNDEDSGTKGRNSRTAKSWRVSTKACLQTEPHSQSLCTVNVWQSTRGDSSIIQASFITNFCDQDLSFDCSSSHRRHNAWSIAKQSAWSIFSAALGRDQAGLSLYLQVKLLSMIGLCFVTHTLLAIVPSAIEGLWAIWTGGVSAAWA
jgi:hypothetical protein